MLFVVAALCELVALFIGSRCGARDKAGFCKDKANWPFHRCKKHRIRLFTISDLGSLVMHALMLAALHAALTHVSRHG